MATIMARMTRSGTFVGPGTNRKLRPGILGCDILSSLKAVQRREPFVGVARPGRARLSAAGAAPALSVLSPLLEVARGAWVNKAG
jgi:hypothetical protein